MPRNEAQLYPDFSAYIKEIDENGISAELVNKIINRHMGNSAYNRDLYNRYMVMSDAVPIFLRKPRFEEKHPINNRINNDFFSEIVDFKTGYFAGEPISYGYSKTDEAVQDTGGEQEVDIASKVLSDFTTRNNMYGVDMETTKLASIYGYAGRLFYIDENGDERVIPVHGYETIILSDTSISEPKYAIRYYRTQDISGIDSWTAEFYDSTSIYTYRGQLGALLPDGEPRKHMFDACPLQGIANNMELMGDAEKVLRAIDDYDKVVSDNSNEIESFVHAYLIFENLMIDEETVEQGQKTGSFIFPPTGTQQGKAYFLTKDINDNYTEHHLQRLQENIYRFSRTPNLNDDTFGTASGVSLKFKLHGLETKCGMFEAKMLDAGQYMFRLLASSWKKKQIAFDPLHATMEFTRNFPLDNLSEAQTAQAWLAAKMPMEWVVSKIPGVDDPDYILDLIARETADVTPLYDGAETISAESRLADEETDVETQPTD